MYLDISKELNSISFMEPVIDGPIDIIELQNEFGEIEYNYPNTYSDEELKDYNLTLIAQHHGYLAYLSAPGYLDKTEYEFFPTKNEAETYLITTFDLCEVCFEELTDEHYCGDNSDDIR